MSLLKIYKPGIFQGSLRNSSYFEGWYFKNVSADLGSIYSFIPGISLTANDRHCFIQVIDGNSGKTDYVRYEISTFRASGDSLDISIGNSRFTDAFTDLDISSEHFHIKGILRFSEMIRYPKSIFSPGIMGWYSFVPFMECNHGIVSVNHRINGSLLINDSTVDFSRGTGYIEKDWGTSFPEAWIWLQSNNFSSPGSSFFFSVAKIPWMGSHFTGLIAFLHHKGVFYLFATYNNSKIEKIKQSGTHICLSISRGSLRLTAELNICNSGKLLAPVNGSMERTIRESIDSEVNVSLYSKNKLIFSDTGLRAGLEITEKIFDYLK